MPYSLLITYGNDTSDTNDHAPATSWKVLITLKVVTAGAATVAVLNASCCKADADPPLVKSKSSLVSDLNGLISKLVVLFCNVVHNILASVPFLKSAGGANCVSIVPEI